MPREVAAMLRFSTATVLMAWANHSSRGSHRALESRVLTFAQMPCAAETYPYPADDMICWPVSARVDNV
jgi:hypothetical protein